MDLGRGDPNDVLLVGRDGRKDPHGIFADAGILAEGATGAGRRAA